VLPSAIAGAVAMVAMQVGLGRLATDAETARKETQHGGDGREARDAVAETAAEVRP
jgi:hypothetical protein